MKTKILSAFLLTVILSVAMASAQLITITQGPTLTQSNTNTYFNINGAISSNVSFSSSTLKINDGSNNYLTLTFSPSSVNQELSAGSSTTVNAAVLIDPNFLFKIQTYTFPTFNVTATNSQTNDTEPVTISLQKTFCKSGENGTALSLSSVTVHNNNGDDTSWKPLDTIKITVKVDNNGNDNVRSTKVQLGLIDPNGRDIVGNLDNLDSKTIDLGTINSGSEKTATYNFQVPSDFKDQNYQLVIKAFSNSLGETNLCTSSSSDFDQRFFQSVSGTREDRAAYQVVADNLQISPTTAQCGDKVQLSTTIDNIGDTDYTDQVKVNLYNQELGIDQDQIIRSDLNQGDSQTVDFAFNIPQNATEKNYILELRTYYDYNVNSDNYRITSANRFTQSLQVSGNCQAALTPSNVRITADLDSSTPEAIAGKQLIIDATVQNNGATASTFDMSVSGNSAWSTISSIDPQSITLAPGQSKQVTIIFNINSDATGDKNFNIRATSTNNNQVTEVPVALSVTPQSSATNAFAANIQANWLIYLIILVNVILIIAIILVIRRMLSSPRRRSEYQ